MPYAHAEDHEALRGFMGMFRLYMKHGCMIDQEIAINEAIFLGVTPDRIRRWEHEEQEVIANRVLWGGSP